MWVKCTVGSGWLLVTLSLAIASHKPSFITKNCYSWDSLSQAIDTLYVKAAQLKETVPEDSIKNVRLLKKNTKKLFLTNCRFQEQLLSFFMDDVFGQLQFQAFNETDFVEDFHCFRQKLSRCYLLWTDNARRGIIRPRLDVLVRSHSRCGFCNQPNTFLMPKITCASSAREMKSITRMKRTFYGIGNKGIYKAIGELDILLSWIKKFLESIPEIKKPSIEI